MGKSSRVRLWGCMRGSPQPPASHHNYTWIRTHIISNKSRRPSITRREILHWLIDSTFRGSIELLGTLREPRDSGSRPKWRLCRFFCILQCLLNRARKKNSLRRDRIKTNPELRCVIDVFFLFVRKDYFHTGVLVRYDVRSSQGPVEDKTCTDTAKVSAQIQSWTWAQYACF